MHPRAVIHGATWLLLTLVVLPAIPAQGACPAILCDCYGAARGFRLVASRTATLAHDRFFATDVDGDVCATQVKLKGQQETNDTKINFGGLFAISGPATVAVRILNPFVHVGGVVATGGGAILGPVSANGGTDVTGTHPGITSCSQAIADATTASQTLAALAPTQELGLIEVADGEIRDVNAGPGLEVIDVTRISLKSDKGLGGGRLRILNGADTEGVVINTGNLAVGRGALLQGFDAGRVIINIAGQGPSVVIQPGGTVTASLLAPERLVRASGSGSIDRIYARGVTLRGKRADGGNSNTCPIL